MFEITLDNQVFDCADHESVLDALLRQGIAVPNSCRQGICQSCLLRSLTPTVPEQAQQGLRAEQKALHYFLACQCYPKQAMHIRPNTTLANAYAAEVVDKQALNNDIVLLTLQFAQPFAFYAGQFVQLTRADGLSRCYSIASTPANPNRIELHIRKLPAGQFSSWVVDELRPGERLGVSEAQGLCFYLPGNPEQPLLLIGTGSGLAPLYGIVLDALAQGHSGDIHLFHGSRSPDGLYLQTELRALQDQYQQFHYTPCVSGVDAAPGYSPGRAEVVAFQILQQLKGWRVFLCGHPEMIAQAQIKAFLKGASVNNIATDAFTVSHKPL